MSNNTVEDEYDYVIVGGGTSGLVVASRLSEDAKLRILVVEAGGDHKGDVLVETPGLLGELFASDKYNWGFHSVPQVSWPFGAPCAVVYHINQSAF